MTWLLLGANGQLGRCLQDVLVKQNIKFEATNRHDIDICDLQSVQSGFRQFKPSVVVNLAAWTDVDGAENHRDEAFLANATGAGNVAQIAENEGTRLIHISTDYVFDGTKTTPYLTDDVTNPVSVYGQSKLEGEQLVQQFHPNGSWIIRTAWLYSQYGKNFARTIVRKALQGGNLSVVNDSFGQPTSAVSLARQLIQVIERNPAPGIYHGTNTGQATWFDFASAIISEIQTNATVTPVSSLEFPTIAERPKFSVLDQKKWSEQGLESMQEWRTALADVHEAIIDSVKDESR